MGYRSQWILAVYGEPDKIQALITWMRSYPRPTVAPKEGLSMAEVMITILDREQARTEDGRGLSFGSDQTKCYPPWDSAILEIRKRAENIGVDLAYARVGEDLEDHEFVQGEALWIEYTIDLCPVEFPNSAASRRK